MLPPGLSLAWVVHLSFILLTACPIGATWWREDQRIRPLHSTYSQQQLKVPQAPQDQNNPNLKNSLQQPRIPLDVDSRQRCPPPSQLTWSFLQEQPPQLPQTIASKARMLRCFVNGACRALSCLLPPLSRIRFS